MPVVKISSSDLAMAHALEADKWTHERIARLLKVNRSTVTYALRHRKTMLTSQLEQTAALRIEQITARTLRVATRAIVRELRLIADEMENT